jgi:acetyl esterase/lipase
MILMGHSAGAHTAALLTTDRRYLAAVGVPYEAIDRMIGVAGPYDFVIDQPKYQPIFPMASRSDTQPSRFVDGTEPPMLLTVGIPDLSLDPGNTTRMAKRIEEKGGRVTVKTYPGVNHADMIISISEALKKNPAIREDILAFLAGGAAGR